MLFPLKKDLVTQFQGTPGLGGSVSFTITRDFFLDYIYLRVPITVAAASDISIFSTAGLSAVVKRIQFAINDGSRNSNQHDVSGFGALRRASRILGSLDRDTAICTGAWLNLLSTNGDANGTYILTIPLLFGNPQISDPIKSAFYLPLPRYNNDPVLNVSFGALGDIITSGTGTVTVGNPWLSTGKRYVTNVQSPTIDTEVKETSFNISGANPSYPINLDVPGSYASMNIFTSLPSVGAGNVAAVNTGATTANPWALQVLANNIRRFALSDISVDEAYSMANDKGILNTPAVTAASSIIDLFPQMFHLDFLHDGLGMEVGELGSVLDTNLLAGSGSQLQLLANVTTACNVNIVQERLFGDLSPLKIVLGTALG